MDRNLRASNGVERKIKKTFWIAPACVLLALLGFFLPLWEFSALAILLAAFFKHPVLAVAVGLVLDIAYGAPTGLLGLLFFPFTLLALAAAAAREVYSANVWQGRN